MYINFIEKLANNISEEIIVLNQLNEVLYVSSLVKNKANIDSFDLGNLKITYKKNDNKLVLNIKDIEYLGQGEVIEINKEEFNYNKVIILNNLKRYEKEDIDFIIGESFVINDLKRRIIKIANSYSSVLITGDSGSGKEVVARAIHAKGNRQDKPFIAINCAAIPEQLLESELFGYAKGAFSGASSTGKVGKFELANGGVIFLDEIGDMPLNLQVKLLRVLQERKIARIGSNKLIDLDIRVISATNKDIVKMIENKEFREDLYYRINVIPIEVPNLNERKEDIELLAKDFINRYCTSYKISNYILHEEVIEKFKEYEWNGNVRELQNVIEYMINVSDNNIITKELLPDYLLRKVKKDKDKNDIISNLEEEIITLEELEKRYISYAINKYGNNTKGKSLAAKKLGIGLSTLYRKK